LAYQDIWRLLVEELKEGNRKKASKRGASGGNIVTFKLQAYAAK
jgi:hypothetical protein